MRKLAAAIVIFWWSSLPFKAQDLRNRYKNLVPNGSFENFRKPSSDIRKAVPWQQIQSVDYYQRPLDNDTTLHKGGFEGDCYAGFRFRKKYKEFLQVRLVEPLHRGTVYEFSMYIRLAYWSNAALQSFGALFSKAGYRRQNDALRSSMVDSIAEHGLKDGYRWFRIAGYYKAGGGEKYITVGNFSPQIAREMVRLDIFRIGPRESYYFIDDISLSIAPQFEEKIALERVGPDYFKNWEDSTLKVEENIGVGEKIRLHNITFAEEKYYLLPASHLELNKLARYLQQHPFTRIRINGYCTEAGLGFRNQRISELRAREVFEYLIKRGVQNKMTFKGFGSEVPEGSGSGDGSGPAPGVELEIINK